MKKDWSYLRSQVSGSGVKSTETRLKPCRLRVFWYEKEKKNIEPTPRSSVGAEDGFIIDVIILQIQPCQKFKIYRFLRSDS